MKEIKEKVMASSTYKASETDSLKYIKMVFDQYSEFEKSLKEKIISSGCKVLPLTSTASWKLRQLNFVLDNATNTPEDKENIIDTIAWIASLAHECTLLDINGSDTYLEEETKEWVEKNKDKYQQK